ncbi:MAG: hypothetical protein M1838_001225 [Thelocarpon superellum]|nr:MAG: hypothetical protein M1838_001225 [Thelocarpon superellum]
MGKLIKNHWARLIVLTAATYQVAAALEGFFWPKIFWDFLTKNLDGAVKPFPFLQIVNLVLALIGIAWEWPLKYLAGSALHRSIAARLVIYPISVLVAALLYQGTNPALYYMIGIGVYFWAYSEGESIAPEPWTLPKTVRPVFVGVNPGVRTAQTGHAYAHPSNLFWKLLYSSGITPRQCKPEEDQDMPALYMLGFTNIVARPTKDQSELSKAEMDARVVVLEEKIARWKPEAVCIVGKGIWESIWRVRHQRAIRPAEFRYGWQDESENMGMGVPRTKMQGWVIAGHEKDAVAPHQEREHARWSGARVFVATSTSGLAASMRPEEKEAVWKPLGEWVRRRREERGMTSGVGADSGVHGEGRESVKADEEEGGEEAT